MTFDQAQKDIVESEHKRVALFDKNGQQIVPFNSKSVPLEKRLNEIRKRLDSKSTPPGVYQVHAKHYGQKAVPAIYYVSSGDLQAAAESIEFNNTKPQEILVQDLLPAGTVTADQYNELYRQKLELEFRIRELEKEKEELELLVAEIEAEEPEQSGFGLSDNTQQFIKGSLEQVIPLLDKMLQQRDTKLQIEALQVMGQQGQMAQNGAVPPGLVQQESAPPMHGVHDGGGEEISEQEEQYIQAMENLKVMHPDLYHAAMEKMQQSQGGANV